jgi:2-polyprenyl-6-methoxyphenol hydroxylase-like FAD-dependent oxidoreductase
MTQANTPQFTDRTGASTSTLVVGGSLSGLMTALALSRVGLPVTVLERAPAHRPSGAALAVDAADLGRVIGCDPARRALAALGANPGAGQVPARWSALHAGLRDVALADPGIDVRHDTRVVAVGQDEDRAWVRTEDGTRLNASVLIGADGYRSLVRRTQFPAHPEARFAGYTLWLGVGREEAMPAVPWANGLDILPGDGFYLLGYPLPDDAGSHTPGRRRLGWAWYDATRNDLLRRTGAVRNGVVQHSLTGGQIPAGTYGELVRDARRTWPSPWQEAIIETLERREAVCTPISEYVPERLVHERAALVGDAAHVPTPMTGSGFAASLADAGAIADALAGVSHHDVPEALLAYEDHRLHAARRLVLGGQQFSRSFAQDAA